MNIVTNESLSDLVNTWTWYVELPDRIPRPNLLSRCDVSEVTSFKFLFSYCTREVFDFPGNEIGDWKFRSRSEMDGMFEFCEFVPESITQWDVSQVVSMDGMFRGCRNMNLPLEHWNVSNVTNFSNLFELCETFNQPLDRWDVSNAITMDRMFQSASSFNQPLPHWQLNKVRTIRKMFENANAFNQCLVTWQIPRGCDYMSMLGAERFNNYPPKFEHYLDIGAGYVFKGIGNDLTDITAEILTTYKRAMRTNPYLRHPAENIPTVGDVMQAAHSHVLFCPALMELFLVDELAAYVGILQVNPLYELFAMNEFRPGILELVGFDPNIRSSSLSSTQRERVTEWMTRKKLNATRRATTTLINS